MYYFVNTPKFIQSLFSSLTWKIPSKERTVYLTFDDGPTKEVTSSLLDLLNKEKVKATFFCVGKNVEKHPDLFNEIKHQGHVIGNHSNTHINGWKTNKKKYLEDIDAADKIIKSNLFRPPYGRIKFSQINKLKSNFKIIMWDVLGADFDASISPERIEKNILKNTESGSIIVLHDNPNFAEKMLSVLPSIIEKLKKKGFVFSSITPSLFHPT